MLNVMKWCCVAVAAPVLLVAACGAARADGEILADIWVTKYALTRGIQHETAKLEVGGKVALTPTNYYREGEFELSAKMAIAKAEVMRRREIQSLQRRVDKLNEMKFEVEE